MPRRSNVKPKQAQMLDAINSGDLKKVDEIAKYVNLTKNAFSYLKIAVAADGEYPKIVDYFLKCTTEGDIPMLLDLAGKKNYLNIIKLLDSRGTNINLWNWNQLFITSISLGHAEIVRYIADQQKVNIFAFHKQTSFLLDTAEKSRMDILSIILNSDPLFLDYSSNLIKGAKWIFSCFVEKGLLDSIKLMHKISPEIPLKVWQNGLVDAVRCSHVEIVNYILDQKIILVNVSLYSTLIHTCLIPNREILEDSRVAKILGRLRSFAPNLTDACVQNFIRGNNICLVFTFATIKYLCEKFGAKLDNNHLMSACRDGSLPLINYIMDSGVDVSECIPSPMEIAITMENTGLMESLLIRGSDVKKLNPWIMRKYFHPMQYFWRSYRLFLGKVPLDKITGYPYDTMMKILNSIYDIFYQNRFPLVITHICLSYAAAE
ncbi:MAG: hypothetical protein Harvfovirus17_10 [Harvfovirus sp.]|uniref:Ankyrin repeat protein n=1 Tax=Harvfovirus sp. TaxID=2487768 RepID=A0A3G5A1L0_9VIRU|nr:MAG: hypothetical protein Harvfovirus17_10 [Harvfovirus sp.]